VERYTVISADCHAGAALPTYREYLDSRYHERFDQWAAGYESPWDDLDRPEATRNWDSGQRAAELEADGIVAEVIYPNTVPPFFPGGALTALAPGPEDYELRLAGLRTHNRWLAEFCAELPGRRAGIGQILLNDTDDAVADVHWIADNGLTGGVLLPGLPPDAPVEPLHAPAHDPVWAACAERGVIVNAHGGSASPSYGEYPASLSIWLMETTWYSHRPLWTLILSGAFDRHPKLRLALSEQGSGWIGGALEVMDSHYSHIAMGAIGELKFAEPCLLEQKPSDYWHQNCSVAASFLHRDDCLARDRIGGTPKIMWGSDYPHAEGTYPFSEEALASTFEGVDPDEVQAMLAGNAAALYGFDLGLLDPLGAECGPRVDVVAAGLDQVPEGATSLAFRKRVVSNV
jgi:predicted TIM-barrel fold metal-dependent hydrolase